MLCQALDLRSMHHDLQSALSSLIRELLPKYFSTAPAPEAIERVVFRALNSTSTADCVGRMNSVAAATTTPLVDFFSAQEGLAGELANIAPFRAEFAKRAADTLTALRAQYLEGGRGAAPASKYLGKTRAVYEFVRVGLGIPMHGAENLHGFAMGPGVEEGTIGGNISIIHEAIRDGKMQGVVVDLVKAVKAGEL